MDPVVAIFNYMPMKIFTREDLKKLLSLNESPCISLYQPTHRHFPDNQQDSIRFGNLLKQLESSLMNKFQMDEVMKLMKPLHELKGNAVFWNHTLDGLALFRSENIFEVFAVQNKVEELAIVSDSFHLKPLKKYLQTADRYHVLCVDRNEIKLYEGNRNQLDEVELRSEIPRTIQEALGEELTEKHLTVATYGGVKGSGPNIHGHGSKKDEVGKDTERFFRIVDRAIAEHYSKPSGYPLVLAALPEYHSVFHTVSHNPMLLETGVMINAKALEREELQKRSWEVFEPKYLESIEQLVKEFALSQAKQLGTNDLKEAGRAAVASRISKLLVESDRVIPGKLVKETGAVKAEELENPEVDDLLDDLSELVLKMGGQVMVVPAEKMPSKTGLAAIYRY